MLIIVDSGGANISSIRYALERIHMDSKLSADADEIARADHVILPGVGTARAAMDKLRRYELVECLRGLACPVLGICLGMQLLFSHSQEGNKAGNKAESEEGDVDLLNILPQQVKKLTAEPGKTIPHMGWNQVDWRVGESVEKSARKEQSEQPDLAQQKSTTHHKAHPLLRNIPDHSYFYFVHSYFVDANIDANAHVLGYCQYGRDQVSAIIAHDNFMGCQFHPERSGDVGSILLKNFTGL
ncbi:MAG: imidazole glycerol phosphate synthase subunit HisH [Alphaproteobacteria bacterium]|nr:imidazole glycerol phosphate synthase subunit HisH [Alphaproteobacteria bacterium]